MAAREAAVEAAKRGAATSGDKGKGKAPVETTPSSSKKRKAPEEEGPSVTATLACGTPLPSKKRVDSAGVVRYYTDVQEADLRTDAAHGHARTKPRIEVDTRCAPTMHPRCTCDAPAMHPRCMPPPASSWWYCSRCFSSAHLLAGVGVPQ